MGNRREDTDIDRRSSKDKDADWSSVVTCHRASLVAQMVKNPPVMWETWVQSLGKEDPWRRTGNPPKFLPRESHGQRSLAGFSPWSHKESDKTEQLSIQSCMPRNTGKHRRLEEAEK